MALVLKTAPTAEPVTADELRLHGNIDDDADTTTIESYIAAARRRVENSTGLQLMTATYYLDLDHWPCGTIYVPSAPLQSVTAITYTDSAGAAKTWGASEYEVDTGSVPGRIQPAYGYVYPNLYSKLNCVRVEFVAGFGDASTDVPPDLRQAIKLIAQWWYEQREEVLTGTIQAIIPCGAESVIEQYRLNWI